MAIFGGRKSGKDPALLLQRGDAKGAERLLRKHLRKKPGDHRQRNLLGDALVGQGALDAGMKEYEAVADGYISDGFTAKALAIWKKMARLRPEDESLLARIAHLGEERGSAGGPTIPHGTDLPWTPLFPDFRPEEFAEVARTMEHRRFGADETILSEGDSGRSLFVIAEGTVQVSMRQEDRELEVGRLGPGDFFGEVAVLTERQRTASIRTLEPCEVLELREEDLTELIARYPRIVEVMQEFNRKRAEQTVEAIVDSRRRERS